MDYGDILSTGGFPVSKVTIEELNYFDISAEGELLNSSRDFNLAYPSVNNYLTQLDTSELPAEGGAGYLATNEVVYAKTNNFPTSGTILVGREQISYTNKLNDRFLGCTRGVNGTYRVPSTQESISETPYKININNSDSAYNTETSAMALLFQKSLEFLMRNNF